MAYLSDSSILWILFIVLLVISVYYTTKSRLWEGKIGLPFVSYLQGLLLSINLFSENFYIFFSTSIVLGVIYYIAFIKLPGLFQYAKNRVSKNFQPFDDEELTNEIAEIWEISKEKLMITKFFGNKSFNAFRKMSLNKIDIYVGENLLNTISREELKYTLSHEIAHTRIFRYSIFTVMFPILYTILGMFIGILLTSIEFFNSYVFYFITLLLFIIGIIIYNYLSWLNEYKADKLGLLKTQNLNNAISLLERFSDNQKDYGLILNLIFYDHPLPEDRISSLRTLFSIS